MLVLAVDSSTAQASIALVDGEKVLAQEYSNNPKSHSEFINPAINSVLAQARKEFSDIGLLAVDIGPGSFTGVRVAVNIVKTFSFLLSKPIFVYNSLALLQTQVQLVSRQDCIAMINAYKNMVYFSFSRPGEIATQPEAIAIDHLEKKIQDLSLEFNIDKPVLCVGDGYNAYSPYFSSQLHQMLARQQDCDDFPRAVSLGLLAAKNPVATLDWKSVIPLYLRASAAEENMQTR